MKYRKRVAAALISAAMLLTAMPVQTVSAAVSDQTKEAVRKALRNAWEKRASSISLTQYRLSPDEFADIYFDLLYTEGDWFYVGSGYSYSTLMGRYIGSASLEYNYSISEIPAMIEQFNQTVEDVTNQVYSSWTDAETVLFLHDWLAEHCEYDTSYEYADAYSALVGGKSICQGYALAMCVLCRQIGIPCYAITSDELMHMWNVVQVDGKWYQCDVTYDDGVPDMLGHVTHTYMLQSDAASMADKGSGFRLELFCRRTEDQLYIRCIRRCILDQIERFDISASGRKLALCGFCAGQSG